MSPETFSDESRSIFDNVAQFSTCLLDRPEVAVSLLSLAVAFIAMLASWKSASAADQSAKIANVNERNSLARMAQLAAHRILATNDGTTRAANKLKIAYTTLFAFSGGTNSSAEQFYKKKIDELLGAIKKYSKDAEESVANFRQDIDSEMLLKEVIRLEAILVQAS